MYEIYQWSYNKDEYEIGGFVRKLMIENKKIISIVPTKYNNIDNCMILVEVIIFVEL
jgi:hypothetical protein